MVYIPEDLYREPKNHESGAVKYQEAVEARPVSTSSQDFGEGKKK